MKDTTEIDAFPLRWPDGYKRTPLAERAETRRYKVSLHEAVTHALEQIRMMGGTDPVVSSNLAQRRDGLPMAGQVDPKDTGIAFYWMQDGRLRQVCCDHWDSARDNMRALGLMLEALRAMERSGASGVFSKTLDAYAALPSGIQLPPPARPWREVLDLPAKCDDNKRVKRVVAKLLSLHHPDSGGDAAKFREIIGARDAAYEELGRP